MAMRKSDVAALGGFAWEKAGAIWYSTLRDSNLQSTATFSDFARLTLINATFGDVDHHIGAFSDLLRAQVS